MLSSTHIHHTSVLTREIIDFKPSFKWHQLATHNIAIALDTTEDNPLATHFLAKRIFDITVCLLLLPIVLPIMVMLAIAIRLDSRGSVIFKQQRVGLWGQPFTCFKFRSMRIDAEEIKKQLMEQNEADGPVFKMKHDPRITSVGRIIRKLSLDELPQIFNVLLGDMSLVGPRPAIPCEVTQYTPRQLGRLNAMPGLTGLQQVSGRSDLDFEKWIEYDLEYVENQSLLNDIKIMLRTIPVVLLAKGAY